MLVTIAPVFFSTVVSVSRVAEVGALGTALEVSTVIVISLSVAHYFTRRAGCREQHRPSAKILRKRAGSSVVEQGTFNPRVEGSIPSRLTSPKTGFAPIV